MEIIRRFLLVFMMVVAFLSITPSCLFAGTAYYPSSMGTRETTRKTSSMIIADNGKSDYIIVIGENASPSEEHSAAELQKFLKEISGAELPVVTDQNPMVNNEIILGDNHHLRELNAQIDWEKLGDEGFTIRTMGDRLIIAGGRLRGTMYGVYTFLEDYLGCRWLSSRVSCIPKMDRIELGQIDDTQLPILEYRDPYYTDAMDGDWAARNKINGAHARLTRNHGGRIDYAPRHSVHTFVEILPTRQYFADHPEYYSEIDGKRVSERTQLCLTNPDVLRITIDKVREWIKQYPDASIYSVSQNDWGRWCQCESCKAIDDPEGSHSGTMIHFVNQVAEAIERDYPDKVIDTLAYQHTRKPPMTIHPRGNVIVRLAGIESCFAHPLTECKQNTAFKGDIERWSGISDRLYIWDYVTDFSHYILPFPNLYVLKPNIQFFVNHGVKGITEQGNYSPGGGGEFAELRAYLLAKLLWNPDYDVDKAVDEFLKGYYGNATAPLREYINILHKKVRDDNIHMNIWTKPDSEYLSADIVKRVDELFDEAEKLADNEEVLARVRVARLPIQYVKISTLPSDDPERLQIIREFFEVVDKESITHIGEQMEMDAYREKLSYEPVKIEIQDEPGLEIYYDFDTHMARDRSGNGRDGIVMGSRRLIDGAVGKAWEFGGNTRISMDFDIMTAPHPELSIRCFILPKDTVGQHVIYDEGGGFTGFSVRIMDGQLQFATVSRNANRPTAVIVSAELPDTNDWIEIAAVFGKGRMLLYIDGKQVGEADTDWQELGEHGQIGSIGQTDGNTAFLEGSGWYIGGIDELRIYSRMLLSAELDTGS